MQIAVEPELELTFELEQGSQGGANLRGLKDAGFPQAGNCQVSNPKRGSRSVIGRRPPHGKQLMLADLIAKQTI